MNIEFGAVTCDEALKNFMETYAIRKRDLVTIVLEKGTYLNQYPVIDDKTSEAVNTLVSNGIIPVAVAEAIMARIDKLKKEKTSSEKTGSEK